MNPLRPMILAASSSPRMKRLLTRFPITAEIVRRFVAGETRSELLGVAAGLLAGGRMVSVDFLGENTTDRAQAEATVAEYRALIRDLAALDRPALPGIMATPVEVSVKLSALGQALPADGPAVATENLRVLSTEAERAGVWVTVDAEDRSTTDATLAAVRELRAEFPWLGAVLQSYLHRTEADCRGFTRAGSRIRLCKGAYREPREVAFQRAGEVTESFLRCLDILMRGKAIRWWPRTIRYRSPLPSGWSPNIAVAQADSSIRCCTGYGTASSCGWRARAGRCGSTCPTAASGTAI